MDVTITIPSELQPKVEEAARRRGKDIAGYIEELIVREVLTPAPRPADEAESSRKFAEIVNRVLERRHSAYEELAKGAE